MMKKVLTANQALKRAHKKPIKGFFTTYFQRAGQICIRRLHKYAKAVEPASSKDLKNAARPKYRSSGARDRAPR